MNIFSAQKPIFASFQIWLPWRRQTPILGTLSIEAAFTGNDIKIVNGKDTECNAKKMTDEHNTFKSEKQVTKSKETDDIQLNWQKIGWKCIELSW